MLEKLRAAAVAAYRSWASWSAVSLAAELRALVLADDLLCSNTVPLSWQVRKLAAAPGVGGAVERRVPACLSTPIESCHGWLMRKGIPYWFWGEEASRLLGRMR